MDNGADFLPGNNNSLLELWAWYKSKTETMNNADEITREEITTFSRVVLFLDDVEEILLTPPAPAAGPVCLVDYNNPETQKKVMNLINDNQDAAALLTNITPPGSNAELIKQLLTFGYLIGQTEKQKGLNANE